MYAGRLFFLLTLGGVAVAVASACSSGSGDGAGPGSDAGLDSGKSCLVAPDCDDDNSCTLDTCVGGKCAVVNAPDGLAPDQEPGDCRTIECKDGLATVIVDDGDVPDDDEECTFDRCENGVPVNQPKIDKSKCTVGQGTGTCQQGKCVVPCTSSTAQTQCDDLNPCTEDACLPCSGQFCLPDQGVCDHHALNNVPTPDASQTSGDCKEHRCIEGKDEEVNDDLDLPEDGSECTQDVCKSGEAAHPPEPKGKACGGSSNYICDGEGDCVSCITADDCEDYSGPCRVKACKNGSCSSDPLPAGTPCGTQGQTCSTSGSCCSTCESKGATCGTTSDGCGGTLSCGTCASGETCYQGACCTPKTCIAGVSCGTQSDGCGGTLTCGTCAPGDTCSSGKCGCTNGIKNGSETGVDCGGSCAPCTQGQPCLAGSDCTTGNCADGVCCDSACSGTCQACTSIKTGMTTGTCANVKNGTDPDAECPATTSSSCGTTGLCSGGACAFHAATVQCGAASCSGGVLTAADFCSGSGSCVDGGQSSCAAPYVCANSTSCQSCSDGLKNGSETDTDCGGGGSYGKCANGKKCVAASDCSSGSCVDGYCCNTSCAGVCVACNLSGKLGTCSPLPANTDPLNECPGNNTCNGAGACN